MTELDKFKRRLVRSVSHLLKQDETTQAVIWEQLSKETGCDCKLLWERMRALTTKKLKRLLAVDDNTESVAAVARLSVTDWLLFDLVLVHQKFDVIGRDQILRGAAERPILHELFELVQQFDIENQDGKNLAEAWNALTRLYNSKGRQCSPMLLQRRWYQLKELTRGNFYRLWNNYRGNNKLWASAAGSKPSALQTDIARVFPAVITIYFPDWSELVEQGKVILPESFEQLRRLKTYTKAVDDKPDLVVIEPVIETIELGDDSDKEDLYTEQTKKQVNLALVKQEPVDGLCNVQILETTHIPIKNEHEQTGLETYSEKTSDIQITNVESSLQEEDTTEISLNDEEPTISKLSTKVNTPNVMEASEVMDTFEAMDTSDSGLIPDDLIKQKAEEYITKTKLEKYEKNENSTKPDIKDPSDESNDDMFDDIIKRKADDFVRQVDMKKLVHDVVDEYKLPSGLAFVDDGIEFVDDGIEFIEEDDDKSDDNKLKQASQSTVIDNIVKEEPKDDKEPAEIENKITQSTDKEYQAGSPKFDLKLLMNPIVYTTKLDDMIVFKGKKFNFVRRQQVIDNIIIESKPVSKLAINVEGKCDNLSRTDLSQKDESNDDLVNSSTHNKTIASAVDTTTVDKTPDVDTVSITMPVVDRTPAIDLNENISNGSNEEVVRNDSDNSSDEESQVDETLKVKPTSYLLKKPRSRSYNPIQLCKNPDFNTRLKRLTAGFFCSERNRLLLSACKPMTVDMHKAFEDKLINGTLYLKPSAEHPQPVTETKEENAQSSSVIPSAMPVQSLFSKDNTNVDISELIFHSPHIDTVDLTQRTKTINLRDLSEIRRINQHLQIAQVPPMRVENVNKTQFPIARPRVTEDKPLEPEANECATRLEDPHTPKIIDIAGRQDLSVNKPLPDPTEPLLDITKPKAYKRVSIDGVPGGTYVPADDEQVGTEASELVRSATPNVYRGATHTRGRGRGGRGAPAGSKPYRPANPSFWASKPTTTPSWLKRPLPKQQNLDDFLITVDTLNRMINKLDGKMEYGHVKKNKKLLKPNSFLQSNSDSSNQKNDKSHPFSGAESNDSIEAPVVIESDDTAIADVAMNVTVGEASDSKKDKKKNSSTQKKPKYCCWSREKITKLQKKGRMYTRHSCPSICQCCCRQLLSEEMRKIKIMKNVSRLPSNDDAIVLSDDEIYQSDNDSNDVMIPGFDPDAPTPKIRVHAPKINETKLSRKNSTSKTECMLRGLPLNVAGVSATYTKPTDSTVKDPVPLLRINVNFTSDHIGPTVPFQPDVTNVNVENKDTPPKAVPTSVLERIAAQLTPASSIIVSPELVSTSAQITPNKVTIPVSYHQTPVINTCKRKIVIDASGSDNSLSALLPVSKRDDRAEKVLFLNSNTIAKKPKESPIFLGKNKILLTTVKIPPNLDDESAVSSVPVQPSVVPTLPLPAGVQLVLLPSGELTFTLDPSIPLTEEQFAALPSILAAVKEQINISSDKTSNTTELSANIDNTTATVGNQSLVKSSDQIIEIPDQNDRVESEHEVNLNLEINKNKSESNASGSESLNDLNSSKDSNITTIEEIDSVDNSKSDNLTKPLPVAMHSATNLSSADDSKIVALSETANTNNDDANTAQSKASGDDEINDGASGSRNLLSDLMEMSGISVDDAKLQTQVETPATTTLVGQNNLSVQPNLISTSDTPNLPELCPITSLAELKYACDHNGSFYKLDLDTGVMAPINVSIKRNVLTKMRKVHRYQTRIAPRSSSVMIDLTDDGEAETATNVSKDGTVKPIKLFKRVGIEPPNLLQKRKLETNKLHSSGKRGGNTLVTHSRKQKLDKIEAKIDLVDSDEPMEEEYLVDSSEDEESCTSAKVTAPQSDDDSSDEEPLAKKFMRLKQQNSEQSTSIDKNSSGDNAKEKEIKLNPPEVPSEKEVPPELELPSESIVSGAPTSLLLPQLVAEEGKNIAEHLNSDDMDIEESQFLALIAEETESQDDCILGV